MTIAQPPVVKPPIARQHCRHYSYVLELGPNRGPKCTAGIVLEDRARSTMPCMPTPYSGEAVCPKREEWTEAERNVWQTYQLASLERAGAIMAKIPSIGSSGVMPCPACGGTVHWSRASRNRHLHASCTTAYCFAVIQ